ncbi:MAG: hypothetical protein IH614_18385 [Desulfuromonadales bacterium]|nr:hypothetical protein [Desulfuromonadales bacterium]
MRKVRLLVLLVCGGILSLAACDRDREAEQRPTFYDKARQARDNGVGPPVVLPPERQAYERSVEERLSGFDRRFTQLQERSAARTEAAQVEVDRELEELRRLREVTGENLASLREAGEGEWAELREEVQHPLAELEQRLTALEQKGVEP